MPLLMHTTNVHKKQGKSSIKRMLFVGSILVITVFRFWTIHNREILAVTPSPHDMQLYITTAQSVAQGHWFGQYNERVITRGPVFPLFIAAAYILHIPLAIAQTILYCIASLLFLFCMHLMVKKKWTLIPLYILLLFNPFMFDHETFFQVTRSALYPALSLAVSISCFSLITTVHTSFKKGLGFAVSLGIFFFLFWYYREEGFFLLPLIAVCYGYSIWTTWKLKKLSKRYVTLLFIPILLFCIGTHILSAINKKEYGIYTTREFSHPSYSKTLSVLLRIQPEMHNPLLPLPKQTRQTLYKVSPSFAKLESFFEGEGGYDWAQSSEIWTHISPEEHELAGGHFSFALRDAVWDITKPSQQKEQLFLEQLTKEITEACIKKQIVCGLFPISGFTFLNVSDRSQFYEQWVNTIQTGVLANKLDISTEPKYSDGPIEQIALFREVTKGRILTNDTTNPALHQLPFLQIIYSSIRFWYACIMPTIILFFCIHFLFRIFKQNKLTRNDWFQSSLLLCSTLFYGVVAFYGSIKSPTNTTANSYTSGAYALLLLFVCFEVLTALQQFTEEHNQ